MVSLRLLELLPRGQIAVNIDAPTAEFVTRVLRESSHPEALIAAKKMVRAALESQVRQIEFDNKLPAPLTRQAG